MDKKPDFQSIVTDPLPVLEEKTWSQMMTGNVNAIHAAWRAFLQTEASEKIQRALRLKITTSGDISHFTRDLAYVKRNNCNYWIGLGTVIGQGGQ